MVLDDMDYNKNLNR